MILSGQSIRRRDLITPFSERTEFNGMTFGVGPAGYDLRVEFDKDGLVDSVVILPGQHLLASTIEHFTMPPDLLGVVHDKSSWARRGLVVQNTVIEPGWFGFLTLELSNHGSEDILIRKGSPIAQVIFHVLDEPAEAPYYGKYSGQERGPQSAR